MINVNFDEFKEEMIRVGKVLETQLKQAVEPLHKLDSKIKLDLSAFDELFDFFKNVNAEQLTDHLTLQKQSELDNLINRTITENEEVFSQFYNVEKLRESFSQVPILWAKGEKKETRKLLSYISEELESMSIVVSEEENGNLFEFVSLAAQEFHNSKNQIKRMFQKEKWIPYLHLPPYKINEWFKIYTRSPAQEKPKVLEKYILNHFDHSLVEHLFGKWIEGPFPTNKDCLNEAIERYVAGNHISCIHIMYPQIEKLLVEGFELVDGINTIDHKTIQRQARLRRNTYISTNRNDMFDIAKHYLDKSFFGRFTHGRVAEFTRHSVGHGGYEGPFTQANSLRLILLYDLFFELLKPIPTV